MSVFNLTRIRLVIAGIAVATACIALFAWRAINVVLINQTDGPESNADSQSMFGGLERPAPPRNDFVGSSVCTECHPRIAELYRSHSMANSLFEAVTAPPLEDFENVNSFAPDPFHTYAVEKTSNDIFHHERFADENGKVIYDQSVRIDYAMGSGHQGRSYLIDRGGLMFMSPVTWYTTAARWDLSPQYKLPSHRRFERRIVNGCVNCHAGRANFIRGTEDRFGSPPFYELSIGCERCHGPGGEHVSARRAGRVDAALDPIVNPARLDASRREDVCAQCHLQGQGTFPRYGCEIGDFRPGQRLEETAIVFVAGTRMTADGTTRAVSQVEQSRSSRCFQSSGGQFGCISCHDPHSRPASADLESFYRQKCLNCHSDINCNMPLTDRLAVRADDSCIGCHMPRLGANDVPHTSQTDHRILRNPGKVFSSVNSFELPEFYDHAEDRLPRLAIDYARGLWLAENAEKRTDRSMANRAVMLLSPVSKKLPDDARILNALGTASAVQGRFDDALGYWEKCLDIDPDRDQTLDTVAILLQNAGRNREARVSLERFLKLNPWRANAWGRHSRLLGLEGEWEAAIVSAKKAEELDPSVPQTYQFLSDAYRQTGNASQRRIYSERFEQIKRLRK